jgi:site-specific DNA recombinase
MPASEAFDIGITYRLPFSTGRPAAADRCAGAEIETIVTRALRAEFTDQPKQDDQDLIHSYLVRVGVRMEQLAVTVRTKGPAHALANGPDDADQTQPERTLLIPWQKAPSKRRREIIVTSFIGAQDTRPIRADTRAKLVASIARGRRWLQEIISGAVTDAEKIAAREQCSVRHVNMSISLAFLAPDLVKAATEGRLPRGIGVARLCDGPSEWSRQCRILGLPAP